MIKISDISISEESDSYEYEDDEEDDEEFYEEDDEGYGQILIK